MFQFLKFVAHNGVDDTYTLSVEPGVAENLDVTDGVTQQLVQILHYPNNYKFTTLIIPMEAVIVYRGFAQGSLSVIYSMMLILS